MVTISTKTKGNCASPVCVCRDSVYTITRWDVSVLFFNTVFVEAMDENRPTPSLCKSQQTHPSPPAETPVVYRELEITVV